MQGRSGEQTGAGSQQKLAFASGVSACMPVIQGCSGEQTGGRVQQKLVLANFKSACKPAMQGRAGEQTGTGSPLKLASGDDLAIEPTEHASEDSSKTIPTTTTLMFFMRSTFVSASCGSCKGTPGKTSDCAILPGVREQQKMFCSGSGTSSVS
jgi:hypothetical protein